MRFQLKSVMFGIGAVVVAAGVAWAATSSVVIQACAGPFGLLRLAGAGGCLPFEQPLQWSAGGASGGGTAYTTGAPGPVNVPVAISTSIAHLNLPAGAYLVHAKATLSAPGLSYPNRVTCRIAGADATHTDQTTMIVDQGIEYPLALQTVQQLATAAGVDVFCFSPLLAAAAVDVRLSAQSVDAIVNQ